MKSRIKLTKVEASCILDVLAARCGYKHWTFTPDWDMEEFNCLRFYDSNIDLASIVLIQKDGSCLKQLFNQESISSSVKFMFKHKKDFLIAVGPSASKICSSTWMNLFKDEDTLESLLIESTLLLSPIIA